MTGPRAGPTAGSDSSQQEHKCCTGGRHRPGDARPTAETTAVNTAAAPTTRRGAAWRGAGYGTGSTGVTDDNTVYCSADAATGTHSLSHGIHSGTGFTFSEKVQCFFLQCFDIVRWASGRASGS